MDEKIKGNGIQSVEIALEVLKTIAFAERPLTISEIAKLCDMSKSKLHRYLTSLCRKGILVKGENLRYTLGHELALLGLKAAGKINILEIAGPILASVKDELGEPVALALWGETGPFFAKMEESDRVIQVGVRLGTQFSVTQSATGKIFAAFLRKEKIEKIVEQELSMDPERIRLFYDELKIIKDQCYAATDKLIDGFFAISCPVFNSIGEMEGSLTVMGPSQFLDISGKSHAVSFLKEKSSELSRMLGYHIK